MSDSDRSSHCRLGELPCNPVSTKELIKQMSKYPNLWDRSCAQYRDRTAKEKTWKIIYTHFYPDFDSLKKASQLEIGHLITKKWNNVRDAYRKSLRPGSRTTNRPYVYANLLTFLKVHVHDADPKPDRSTEDVDNDDSNWCNEVFIDIDNDHDVNGTPSELEQPKLEYDYTSRADDISEVNISDDNIVSVLASLIKKEEDEDRAFFKSITPAVKRLSESSKFTFRIQVMKLLNGLQMNDRRGVSLTRRSTHLERTAAMESDSD